MASQLQCVYKFVAPLKPYSRIKTKAAYSIHTPKPIILASIEDKTRREWGRMHIYISRASQNVSRKKERERFYNGDAFLCQCTRLEHWYWVDFNFTMDSRQNLIHTPMTCYNHIMNPDKAFTAGKYFTWKGEERISLSWAGHVSVPCLSSCDELHNFCCRFRDSK